MSTGWALREGAEASERLSAGARLARPLLHPVYS